MGEKIRVICWFSCGSSSAVAAKLAIEKYGAERVEVIYCDTLKYEHPDNLRFLNDVGSWLGKEIKIIGSKKYKDIYDVFDRTNFLVGAKGLALCTIELKKRIRFAYQQPDDIHIIGYTIDEEKRIKRLLLEEATAFEFPLFDNGLTKREVNKIIESAGIKQPEMYRLGYNNNNCIGCVKGGAGYWNKIRRDFPYAFDRMAKQERKMGATILSDRRKGKNRARLYLDELNPKSGRMSKEKNIDCGVLCLNEPLKNRNKK